MTTYIAMRQDMQIALIASVRAGDYAKAAKLARQFSDGLKSKKPKWHSELAKLADFLDQAANGFIAGAPFAIFNEKGNQKLPFVAFSALPGFGFCPGAGDCDPLITARARAAGQKRPTGKGFCYSIRAWRYPAAFCRQVQNTVLQEFEDGRVLIREELSRIVAKHVAKGKNNKLVLRLFVDGDFMSLLALVWWMDTIAQHVENLAVYGYSKSLDILLNYHAAGYQWPANYLFNLSSGSNASAQVIEKVKELPIYRGDFIALPYKGNKLPYGSPAYTKQARDLYDLHYPGAAKPFVCPGECGKCTAKSHACGSSRFAEIPIVILAH